jgi:predicted esterase YcpF (UPF0227 family)
MGKQIVVKRKGGKGLTSKSLQSLLDASYKKKEEAPSQVNGYNYDRDLSTDKTKVYVHPESKHTVVAHRGTNGISDWGNNAVYALTGRAGYKTTNRYKDAKKVHEAAEQKYGKENISSIGHSQGGLLARMLGSNNKEVIAFNPAYHPFGGSSEKIKENEHIIRHPNDIISIGLARNKAVQQIKNPIKSKSRSDIHSFKQLANQGNDAYGNKNFGETTNSAKNRAIEQIKNRGKLANEQQSPLENQNNPTELSGNGIFHIFHHYYN